MITLRPMHEADLPFLRALYATTREAELAQVPWTAEQKGAFLDHQFHAQHEHWQTHYTGTSWDVVEENDIPVGRLYVGRWADEIRIVDIALLPSHRGRGIGSELIRALFREGDATGRKVSIHVELFNPARALYRRLGFEETGAHGVYLRMDRFPRGA